jgi:hypothetical protein
MRSPVKVSLTAVGLSQWIPLDYLARYFNVGLYASLSQDASGITYSVLSTPDNPNQTKANLNPVASLTQTGGVVTLTWSKPHNLVAGDTAVVWNSGDPNIDGTWLVASTPSDSQITYAAAAATLATGSANTQAQPVRAFAVSTAFTAATTRQQAALTEPCLAVCLRVSALTGGTAYLEVVQGLARG